MKVAVGNRWEPIVETLVRDGRYASVSDVVTEGLRLVSEREAKLSVLRSELASAIAEDTWLTDDEVAASLEATHAQLKSEGY